MIKEKNIWIYCQSQQQQVFLKNCLSYRYNLHFFESADDLVKRWSNHLDVDLVIIEISDFNITTLKNMTALLMNVSTMIVSEFDDLEFINFAFELGADEFFIMPLNQNLFLSKIKRLLYPYYHQAGQSSMDRRFEKLGLTSKELKIMKLLLTSPGNRINRDSMVNTIWGNITVHQKTLDVHIYNLRKKLADTEFSIRSEGGGFFVLGIENGIHQSHLARSL